MLPKCGGRHLMLGVRLGELHGIANQSYLTSNRALITNWKMLKKAQLLPKSVWTLR